jgi:hypothetical protein
MLVPDAVPLCKTAPCIQDSRGAQSKTMTRGISNGKNDHTHLSSGYRLYDPQWFGWPFLDGRL